MGVVGKRHVPAPEARAKCELREGGERTQHPLTRLGSTGVAAGLPQSVGTEDRGAEKTKELWTLHLKRKFVSVTQLYGSFG